MKTNSDRKHTSIVRQQKLVRVVEALGKANTYKEIDDLTFNKRSKWYNENKSKIKLTGPAPRRAFDLFFKHYASVEYDTVRVIYETPRIIIWRATNWCPYLEACKYLGIDTRIFCRFGHESSMDRFVKLVHPNLHFSRSYERIRPYTSFCEELIEFDSNVKIL